MNRYLAKIAFLLLTSVLPAAAQGPSLNVVGYYNLPIFAGDNLIANQLDNHTNTLDSLFNPNTGTVPNGATFRQWDAVQNTYSPVSTYSASSGLWSIDYTLPLLGGGLLHAPSMFTNTFVGDVDQTYFEVDGAGFLYTNYPHYASGYYLLSCPIPFSGASFTNVVGRAPQNGEWVKILDPSTQTYRTTTFDGSSGTWNNGDPSLGIGQAAFFDLGPVAVPEPSAFVLLGLSASSYLIRRRRKGPWRVASFLLAPRLHERKLWR
ncbi:MAG: hypothetical protein C5B50_09600 [Verrucomicrobia bacterium]|nr:MAG: hypothetical protein C5B50_09600 [Verrucomicrobiota bacterium]